MSKFNKDVFNTILTRIVLLVLGILPSIFIARILGPEGKGLASLALILPVLIITFTNWGIPLATTYYTAKGDFSPSEILWNNLILSIVISVFSLVIGFIIIFFFSKILFPGVPVFYLSLALLTIPFSLLSGNLSNIFLGLQRIKTLNYFNLLQSLLSIFLTVIFVVILRMGVVGVIESSILAGLLFVSVLLYRLFRITGGAVVKLNRKYIKKATTYGLMGHISSLFSFLNYRVDIFFINLFLNPSAVGSYSIAVGFAEQLWLVSFAVNLVFFPRIAGEKNEIRRNELTPLLCRTILFISIIGAAILYFFAPSLIILLYSNKFFPAIQPLRILLVGIVTLTVWRILANDLAARGRPELNIYTNFIAVVVNIILNILWIPKVGISGAAWASVVSYTTAAVGAVLIYRKISGNHFAKIIFPQLSDWKLYKNLIISFGKKGELIRRE